MNKYFNEQSTILLTGASSGIGKCLAEILVTKYNSTVLGVGRSEEKLNMVKTLLGDKFIPITADISLESEWERLYNLVTDNGYKLSGIINCAGVLPKFSSFNSEYYTE
ncbi:MAG: SDR family NAD(P)-dependent oxidoreductase, partial [Clostridia bacterium]|nr:SDR family NAD(P)-dependent oxidoreductase [Clostridia bacterium]